MAVVERRCTGVIRKGCGRPLLAPPGALSMKVLITGAGGQVGQALVRSAPTNSTIKALSHAQLDISNQRDVTSYILRCRPDVIINAAAHTAVDRAESEPAAARAINADGPHHLALAA